MIVNIQTQVIRQRRRLNLISPSVSKHVDAANDEGLIYKDVAGFIIFLVIAFSFLMIAMFN
jgi:hypothetical protein